jgi:hypothetical protein
MSTTFPISLDEFKNFFLREAGIEYQPYPNWEEGKTYAAGDKVLHVVNFKVGVWESLEDGNATEPARNNSQWLEAEDDEEDMADWVLDIDITRAMGEAAFKYNPRLYTEEKGKMIFLYLTMFFLVYEKDDKE